MPLIAAFRATPRLSAILGTAMVLVTGLVGSQVTAAGDGFSKQLLAQIIVLLAALVVGFVGDDPAIAVAQTTSGYTKYRSAQIVLAALWWAAVPGLSLLFVTRTNALSGDVDLVQFVMEGWALAVVSLCVGLASRRRTGSPFLAAATALLVVSIVVGARYPAVSVVSPDFVERGRLSGLVLLLLAMLTLVAMLLGSGSRTGRRHLGSLQRLGPMTWNGVRSTPMPVLGVWAAGTLGSAAAGLMADAGLASTVARICLLLTAVAMSMAVVENELPPTPVRVQVLTATRFLLLTPAAAVAILSSFIPDTRLAIEAVGMGGLALLLTPHKRQHPARAAIAIVLALSLIWSVWPPLGLDTNPESPGWVTGQRAWMIGSLVLWLIGTLRLANTVPSQASADPCRCVPSQEQGAVGIACGRGTGQHQNVPVDD